MLRCIRALRDIVERDASPSSDNPYGLYVDTSHIPEAGKGLFAGVDIPRNAFITRYAGNLVSWEEAEELRRKGLHTHCKSVFFGGPVIDGHKGHEVLDAEGKLDARFVACGIASLTNDARDPKKNNTYFFKKAKDPNTIWLRAKHDIPRGSELYVSYGRGYWRQ